MMLKCEYYRMGWAEESLSFAFYFIFYSKCGRNEQKSIEGDRPTDSVCKELRIITMMKFTEKRPLSLSHGPFFSSTRCEGIEQFSKIVFIWHRARVKAAESKKTASYGGNPPQKIEKQKKVCV